MPSVWSVQTQLNDNSLFNDPRMKTATKVALEALALSNGFPLIGLFIFGSGNTPDFILHRNAFPLQTGANKETKLQSDLDNLMADVYETVVNGEAGQFLFAKTHIWNYKSDLSYIPRFAPGIGDFALYVSDNIPPANWWTEF